MQFEYQGMSAEISYSAATKSYFGEIEYNDQHIIVFQTSSKQELVDIMRKAIEEFSD